MSGFLGEYDATLDAKGRFLLPAALRKQMPEDTTKLVINRGLDTCLSMYLLKDWALVMEKIEKVNPFDSAKNRQVRRLFVSGAIYVDLDSAGRINLPKQLMDYAQLEKDIVLAADINKIEIWDAGNYKKLFESITPEMMSDLASSVLGSGSVPNG